MGCRQHNTCWIQGALSEKIYSYVSFYECYDKSIHLQNFGQFHLHLVPFRSVSFTFPMVLYVSIKPFITKEHTVNYRKNKEYVPEKMSIGALGANKTL